MIVVVQKAFRTKGKDIVPGTVVDASNWRNLDSMLEVKYVREARESEVEKFKATRKSKFPVKKKILVRRRVH